MIDSFPTKYKQFFNSIQKTAEYIKKFENISIFHDADIDGVSSFYQFASCLEKLGINYTSERRNIRLPSNQFEYQQYSQSDLIICLDNGSMDMDWLQGFNKPVVIIDHHPPSMESYDCSEQAGIPYYILNPHVFGIDGGTEFCTSILTAILCYYMDSSTVSNSWMGLVGAMGDAQVNSNIGNDFVQQLAKPFIQKEYFIYSKLYPQIKDSIFYSVDPYIMGYTGNMPAIKKHLTKYSIIAKQYKELSKEQRQSLSESLYQILYQKINY